MPMLIWLMARLSRQECRAAGLILTAGHVWNFAVGLGAAIFGVGMVLYGYCPGTGLAAVATGRLDALAGLAGMIVGGFAYALTFDWVAAHILPVGAYGKLRLPELLGLPEWVCYVGLVFMAAGIFALVAKAEKKA